MKSEERKMKNAIRVHSCHSWLNSSLNFFLFSFLFALFSLLFVSCNRTKPYTPQPPRTISVRDVYITGDWKDFIKIEDGDYVLEDIGNADPRISLRITLLQTFTGRMDDPASTLRLNALSSGGSDMGKEFWINSSEKFNDFVRGPAGVTTSISFEAMMFTHDTWFANVAGFDAKTIQPRQTASGGSGSSVAENPASGPSAPVTRNTATDPIFDTRTQARTGPRIVAVPEFTGTANVPSDLIVSVTGTVINGLMQNKGVHSVVDYSRIYAAQTQLRFEASDWSNPAKYAEIGRVLNVDTITVGTVSEGGKTLFMQQYDVALQLIDIATLSVVGAYSKSIYRDTVSEIGYFLQRMEVRE
jgi:hypothetical protein